MTRKEEEGKREKGKAGRGGREERNKDLSKGNGLHRFWI